jgi:Na+-transporting NADH:ubiquinone oxidoreductase subunit NqrF
MEAMNGEDINKRNETNYKDDTINKAYEMANSPDERLFSFMNMWFIFRKAAPKTKKTKNTDT